MQAELFVEMPCELGEGPLWAGDRLFWFDIKAMRLHAAAADGSARETWSFDEHFSAAAQLDKGLLLASETGLWRFNPDSGARTLVAPLEADNAGTRSNDGRADRQGGFWIGTMSKTGEKQAGALYRFHRGEIRKLRSGLTTPNALCFSPDGGRAYFSDTAERRIYAWRLDPQGWPAGDPLVLLDFGARPGAPDGAVIDAQGALWCALWGAGRVLRVLPDGRTDTEIILPVSQPTCPAFGGDPQRLFITTAWEGFDAAAQAREPLAGSVFTATVPILGVPEPLVDLPG